MSRWRYANGRRFPFPLAVALIVALVLPVHAATTAVPTGDDVPRFEPGKCGFTLTKTQTEGRTVNCGYVVVPLRHSDPTGPTIRLAVARFVATSEPREAEPILFLQGGPGGSALDDTAAFFARFVGTRDFILFDQRGVGQSQPALNCPEGDAQYQRNVSQPLTPTESEMRLTEAYGRCRDRLAQRYDLTAFTTAENAADVNDIRIALGYERINLLGASYGTRLALTVMRDFPQIVRSVVLDGISPPGIDPRSDFAPSFDRALTLFFDACATDPACAAAFPALQIDFDRVVADLDARPLPISRTSGSDDEVERTPDLLLTGTRFIRYVQQFLYSARGIRYLPAVIAQLRDRDTTLLRLLLAASASSENGTSEGMYWSVWCSDYAPFSSREQSIAAAASVRPAVRDAFLPWELREYDTCERWGAAPPRAVENAAVASDIPALVLTTANDPVTPPVYAQRAIQTLSHATYVESPGIGHTVIANGGRCSAKIVQEFYANPQAAPDTSCVDDLAVHYLPPVRQYAKPPPRTIDSAKGYTATMTTTEGVITLDLFADVAPQMVNSFVFLAGEGFFDGMGFYGIAQDYGFANGDPTETGYGGPGYTLQRDPIPPHLTYDRGVIVATNDGTNVNGSRFAILSSDQRNDLKREYVIFGRVREGMDVVDRILTWHDAAFAEPRPHIISVTVQVS